MGKETFLRVNDIKLRYKELNKGASRPLVMFNGTALNYETWKPLSTRLDRHMIMIDLPGVGGSSLYSRLPHMKHYAEDMFWAVRFGLGIDEPVDVMGYSFGGALAQAYTELYPNDVNRLVLLSTTPGFTGSIPSLKAIMMSMTFGKALLMNILGRPGDDGDVVKNFKAPHGLGPVYSTAALYEWAKGHRAENEKHHTLIVHGSKDTLLPVKNAYVLHNNYKKSQLIVESGYDHMVPLVRAEELSKDIQRFLEA